ncbi:hypothetical protein [uncultured Microbacterium sp.]|uniref:hypothetical protein n=1 Tax=uncultured Microbacterium sp. TaxID=191216 RepID=UPI0025EA010C|nr:hypothetical protein [uncultured Microbacterium sp.]
MDTLPLVATAVGIVVTISTTILGGTKWMLQRVEQRSDRRFEQVDKRFEQVDKRFEQVDKRFEQVDQQLRSVVDSVTELKIAVARIEGPHPPFLIARG